MWCVSYVVSVPTILNPLKHRVLMSLIMTCICAFEILV